MKPEADAPSTCAQSTVRRATTEYQNAGGSGHNPQRIARSALFFFKPDYTMIPSDAKQARPRPSDNDMRCLLTYCWRDGEEMKELLGKYSCTLSARTKINTIPLRSNDVRNASFIEATDEELCDHRSVER